MPDRGNRRQGKAVLAHSVQEGVAARVVQPGWQGHEAAGHIAFAARKQINMNAAIWLAFSLFPPVLFSLRPQPMDGAANIWAGSSLLS